MGPGLFTTAIHPSALKQDLTESLRLALDSRPSCLPSGWITGGRHRTWSHVLDTGGDSVDEDHPEGPSPSLLSPVGWDSRRHFHREAVSHHFFQKQA